jgi:hypothetical protein
MLRRVALVRTDVSEESSASFFRVTRIGELGTTLAATSNYVLCLLAGEDTPEERPNGITFTCKSREGTVIPVIGRGSL